MYCISVLPCFYPFANFCSVVTWEQFIKVVCFCMYLVAYVYREKCVSYFLCSLITRSSLPVVFFPRILLIWFLWFYNSFLPVSGHTPFWVGLIYFVCDWFELMILVDTLDIVIKHISSHSQKNNAENRRITQPEKCYLIWVTMKEKKYYK